MTDKIAADSTWGNLWGKIVGGAKDTASKLPKPTTPTSAAPAVSADASGLAQTLRGRFGTQTVPKSAPTSTVPTPELDKGLVAGIEQAKLPKAPPRRPTPQQKVEDEFQRDYDLNTPNALAAAASRAMQMTQSGADSEAAKAWLTRIQSKVQSSGMSAEQHQAFQDQVALGMLPGGASLWALGGMQPEARKALLQPIKNQIQKSMSDEYAQTLSSTLKSTDKWIKDNPEQTGFTNWATANWKNILAPIGLIMMIFGNSTSKMIGALALGVGSYNLGKRAYNLMGSSEDAQRIRGTLTRSAAYKDESGKHVPFGDIEQYKEADPDAYQAIMDYGFITRTGFRDKMLGDVKQRAAQFAGTFTGAKPSVVNTTPEGKVQVK